MADDLSLLLKIRGENASAKTALADTRAGITALRSHLGSELQNMNTVTQGVFGDITKHLNLFVGERIPLIGGAFLKVTENVRGMGKEVESAGGGLATFGGVAGIATIALTALAAVAVGVSVALFEIVKKASEAGLELEHIIEKTGLGAKTITALKFAAEESGLSIEGFDTGMKLFANTVAKAAQGSNSAALALRRLGITPKEALTDLDGTLAKVFKRIYDAPPGIEKMSLAADAFGRRMGANIIPLIESFHGNLGELIKRAEELGVTLDDEGVKSLAEFERNMNSLKAQALGLERVFAVELAPTLSQFLHDLSSGLAANRAAIQEWGKAASDVFSGVRVVAQSEFGQMLFELSSFTVKWLSGGGLLVQGLRALGAGDNGVTDPRFKTQGYDPKTGLPDSAKKIGDLSDDAFLGKVKKEKAEKLSAAQKLLNQLTEEYTKLQDKANKLTGVQIVAEELLGEKYKGTSAALRDQILTEAAHIDRAKEAADLAKKKADATQKIRDLLNSQTEAINKARLGDDEYEAQIITLEAELHKLGLTMDDNTKKLLQDNAETQKTLALTRERIVLTQTLIDRLERQRAVEKENQDRLLGIDHAQGDETRQRRVNAPLKNTASQIEQLHAQLADKFSGKQLQTAQAGVEALAGAFEGLGHALGNVVQSFVLYGTAGTTFRKVTAEILAGVAQQAAVKAVFELAEGFAALARAFFGDPKAGAEAGAHFTSAAIYGSIAGIAAIAGRGVAGNAFASQGSGGSSGGSGNGSSSGGSTGSSSNPSSIILGSQRAPVFHLIVEHRGGPAFKSTVVDAWVQDHESGGRSRAIVVKEIDRQR